MIRFLKQFIYGVFYLAFFALILIAIYSSTLKPAPTCFDGKLNQGEKEIDCGGPCTPCEILRLELPRASRGEVKVFASKTDEVFLLGEVLNPNKDYAAAPVSYQFKIYAKNGLLKDTVSGQETIFPLEREYILAKSTKVSFSDISRVELEFSSPKWISSAELLRPALVLENIITELKNEEVVVKGKVVNQSPLIAEEAKVMAIIFDESGFELFASETVVDDIGAFQSKPFAVFFPKSAELTEKIDPALTKTFVDVQLLP